MLLIKKISVELYLYVLLGLDVYAWATNFFVDSYIFEFLFSVGFFDYFFLKEIQIIPYMS